MLYSSSEHDEDASLLIKGAASSLSHDIKGYIGTVGRKLRFLSNDLEKLESHNFHLEGFASIEELMKEINNYIQAFVDIYDTATNISDEAGKNDLADPSKLSEVINQKIIFPINEIYVNLDKLLRKSLTSSSDLSVFTEGIRPVKTAILRLQKNIKLINETLEGQEPNLQLTNLGNHALYAQDILEQRFAEENAELKVMSKASVYADQSMMLILFQNLFDNSIKYARDDRDPKIIFFASDINLTELKKLYPGQMASKDKPEHWVEVRVNDNGVGIPESKQKQVFEAGYRLSEKFREDSSGFGLARCKGIVKAHSGKIFIEKLDEPMSTSFVILLPKNPKNA